MRRPGGAKAKKTNWPKVRRPGIEPGSTAWKATMLTITPATQGLLQWHAQGGLGVGRGQYLPGPALILVLGAKPKRGRLRPQTNKPTHTHDTQSFGRERCKCIQSGGAEATAEPIADIMSEWLRR